MNTVDLNRLCIFCLIQMQTVYIQSKKCVCFSVMSDSIGGLDGFGGAETETKFCFMLPNNGMLLTKFLFLKFWIM